MSRLTRLSMAPKRGARQLSNGKASSISQVKGKDAVTATRSLRRVRSPTSSLSHQDASPDTEDQEYCEESDDAQLDEAPQKKKRKTAQASKVEALKLHERLFGRASNPESGACPMPSRLHGVAYHQPLLLGARKSTIARNGQDALLAWFDSVNSARAMPWRKPWIDPSLVSDAQQLRKDLERRAYEVWISEIMLQQTRVAVVIDYWNRWMARWPTIQDLAAADAQDVLAAWRGLGYYSRATRIHDAAMLVVADPDMDGLLPEDVKVLEARVPGIGRYTAGAISAIVFGRAEALVDGNVLRVLSRQLGLLANVKSDKASIDLLWAAADALVKDMARGQAEPESDVDNDGDIPKSDRPGRWGQALMELGSTVCTPKPNCSECPISSTCRVYQEGRELAKKGSKGRDVKGRAETDIEDLCNLCVPLEETLEEDITISEKPANGTKKQSTLSAFFNTSQKDNPSSALAEIVSHARKFPLKVPKKAVREEETLVCAIRQEGGRYLIHRRPDKGLLAGLWEFPSWSLDNVQATDSASAATTTITSKRRIQLAKDYVSELGLPGKITHQGELGSVPWLFSHLKLTMHVHLFVADDKCGRDGSSKTTSRWSEDIEQESMGTGMRKCWFMVKEADR